jgi:hypothetical protein
MALQFKANLRAGQRVKFFRSHDKATALTGTISKVHDGDDDYVDVDVEPGNGSVARTETAHAADVTVLEDAAVGTSAENKTLRTAAAPSKPLFK